MKINSIPQNANARPAFGMAKLTQKGTELAQTFVADLPNFVDTRCYRKSNMIAPLLKKMQNGAEVNLADFFRAGNTLYPFNNQKFIKKQIIGFSASGAIKRFLNRQATKGEGGITLSEKGNDLVGHILDTFDMNVSNPEVSAKEGRKILKLIQNYLSMDELASRNSIVTNKIFSK